MRKGNYIKKMAMVMLAGLLAAGSAVPALAATKLDTVTDTYWEDDDTVAVWDEVEDANQYEVYLYRDESRIETVKTKKTRYNFKNKMMVEGDYTFRVRALAKSSSYTHGNWSEYSDGFYVNATYAEYLKNGSKIDTQNSGPGAGNGSDTQQVVGVIASGEWKSNETGWWYQYDNGSYPVNTWFQDPASAVWYYFNEQGYMVTGWINVNGQQYYLNASGAMVTGTQTIDGNTYQFNASGALEV